MFGLDCNTESRQSSLRLAIQSDAVFILSYNEHGPWNIIEGQRRMMTKGYKVGGECYLRRRAFIIKRKPRKTRCKDKELPYDVLVGVCKEHSGNGKRKWRVRNQQRQMKNGKDKVRSSYHNSYPLCYAR